MISEILTKHGLDFHIEKLPLVGIDSKGNQVISPYFGLLNTKTNEVINTCKAGYGVSQNADIVDMILKGTKNFGEKLSVTKAGAINGGRRVYMQLAIEGKGKVGDDVITRYVTIIDSNDGTTGLSIGIGDLVMHCENQFFKFYKAGEAKFRHTATIEQKIASIPQLVEIALGKSLEQIKIYNRFLSTPLTKNLADKMVNHVLGYDRVMTSPSDFEKLGKRSLDMMNTLYGCIETETDIVGKNLWGVFNGVTRYTTHHQKPPKRENGLEESLLLNGVGYKKAIDAYDFAMTLVN